MPFLFHFTVTIVKYVWCAGCFESMTTTTKKKNENNKICIFNDIDRN